MQAIGRTPTRTLLFVSVYAAWLWCSTMAASLAGGDGPYDADSWKTMIADDCMAYFDGCNNCRRGQAGGIAACTRKACAVYSKPRCLDEPITEGSLGNTPFEGRLVRFDCAEGNRLRIYYGEYVSGDQRVALADDELMLADEQTHTASRLKRERAASGAKYSNGRLEFWEHGGEAMLRENGRELYRNCIPVR